MKYNFNAISNTLGILTVETSKDKIDFIMSFGRVIYIKNSQGQFVTQSKLNVKGEIDIDLSITDIKRITKFTNKAFKKWILEVGFMYVIDVLAPYEPNEFAKLTELVEEFEKHTRKEVA